MPNPESVLETVAPVLKSLEENPAVRKLAAEAMEGLGKNVIGGAGKTVEENVAKVVGKTASKGLVTTVEEAFGAVAENLGLKSAEQSGQRVVQGARVLEDPSLPVAFKGLEHKDVALHHLMTEVERTPGAAINLSVTHPQFFDQMLAASEKVTAKLGSEGAEVAKKTLLTDEERINLRKHGEIGQALADEAHSPEVNLAKVMRMFDSAPRAGESSYAAMQRRFGS